MPNYVNVVAYVFHFIGDVGQCFLNLFFLWRSQRGQVPPHARPQQRGVQEVPPEQEEEAGACAKQFFHPYSTPRLS